MCGLMLALCMRTISSRDADCRDQQQEQTEELHAGFKDEVGSYRVWLISGSLTACLPSLFLHTAFLLPYSAVFIWALLALKQLIWVTDAACRALIQARSWTSHEPDNSLFDISRLRPHGTVRAARATVTESGELGTQAFFTGMVFTRIRALPGRY